MMKIFSVWGQKIGAVGFHETHNYFRPCLVYLSVFLSPPIHGTPTCTYNHFNETPKFWMGLLFLTKESQTPVFKI